MAGLDDILGGIGSIAGYFGGSGDRAAADQDVQKQIAAWQALNPNIKASTAGTSNFSTLDPATRAAQMDTISDLRNQISQGGMDAIDRSRVNDINNATMQAGKVAAAGATQDAGRRGLLNSTAALGASQVAGQQAAQAGNQAGQQTAALAEQQRQNEIAQQAQVAGATRQQDQAGASAQDAIDKFNAQQTQGAQQQTFTNSATQAGGVSGAYGNQYNANQADAQRLQQLGKAGGTAVGGIANYFAGGA